MAQFVFDSLNKTEVDTGDAFHPATGGEHSSVIVKAGGEVLVDAHGNAMLLDDATWDITVDGYVEVFGGNGNSNGIYLKLFGQSDVSNITVGHGGWVVGADRGIFSWHAANVTNLGHIGGGIGIDAWGLGAFTIENSGEILGSDQFGVMLGNPADCTIVNSGTIKGAKASIFDFGGNATFHVVNTGLLDGDVTLGNGHDDFTDFGGGYVLGIVDLGGGSDSFAGSDALEVVRDGGGSDTVHLGGGNDTYIAVRRDLAHLDGTDQIMGGPGDNFYTAAGGIAPVRINLDSVSHFFGQIAAHTARGQEIGTDHLSGFEKAFGGEGNDTIFGSGAANFLGGGGGNDRLSGLDGDDTLGGGRGLDVLRGGLGKDQLTGGADADHFVFETLADSVVGVNRDVVIDFSHAQFDMIDVHLIDADPNLNGDQSFQFIGAGAFSHAAGELRYAGHVLSGDVDGDGIADFSLHVNAASLFAADFVL